MNKKAYENPEVLLRIFENNDVITSSGVGEGNETSNENGFFLGGTHEDFWN